MGRANRAAAARLPPADEGEAGVEPISLAEFARSISRNRRSRDRLFPAGLFGEPAWDILLELFAAAAEGRPVDVTGACAAAAAPQTTALRHIGKLARIGLVERRPVPGDRRRSLLRLTEAGRARTEQVLTELRQACQAPRR